MSKFFKINVSTIIFNEKGKILIQKRSEQEEMFPGLWGIPGGMIEMKDISIIDGLKREVREEVGVEINNLSFLKENIIIKEIYGVCYIIFISQYLSGKPVPLEDTTEVLWLEENNLNNYKFTPTTKNTLHESFLWKKSQHQQ